MIYITGDTHGEIEKFNDKKLRRLKKGDTLIICGDFGFVWTGVESEQKILNTLSTKKFNILFVDGTHENFDMLEKYPVVEFGGSFAHEIKPNIYHLMRGNIYTVESRKIFAFGGGISHDLGDLLYCNNWFEQETPTEEEMDAGIAQLENADFKIDYIISHEPFSGIKKRFTSRERINIVNKYLEYVFKNATFNKWFFGSLHIDRKIGSNVFGVFNDVIPANK